PLRGRRLRPPVRRHGPPEPAGDVPGDGPTLDLVLRLARRPPWALGRPGQFGAAWRPVWAGRRGHPVAGRGAGPAGRDGRAAGRLAWPGRNPEAGGRLFRAAAGRGRVPGLRPGAGRRPSAPRPGGTLAPGDRSGGALARLGDRAGPLSRPP